MSVTVFLSATFSDLKEERLEVIEAFRRFRAVDQLNVDLVTMEDFGFSDATAIEKCQQLVRSSDAYLGLLGGKYGSYVPGTTISYTQSEYQLAHELGKPVFILEKKGPFDFSEIEDDPDKLRKLNDLRGRARSAHLVMPFGTRQELGKALAQYLPRELQTKFSTEELAIVAPTGPTVSLFQLRDRAFTMYRADAHSLDVLAMSAIGFLRDRDVIERYLKAGCAIRVLIVKPGGMAQQLIAAQGKADIADDLQQALRRSVRYKESLANIQSGCFALRGLDWMPSLTLFLFDRGLPSAIGWVGTYTPDISMAGGDKWVFELSHRRESSVLSFYFDQFERLWKRSVDLLAQPEQV